ncbi:Uncharacterised protein [Mycobacteroides abscessus subsp. abscessus]|nr:Uncharacterised protein [Mycobacteroides abscessus subsp. abscessus]
MSPRAAACAASVSTASRQASLPRESRCNVADIFAAYTGVPKPGSNSTTTVA